MHNPECYLGRKAGGNAPAAALRSGSLQKFQVFREPGLAPPPASGQARTPAGSSGLKKKIVYFNKLEYQNLGRAGSVLKPDGQCRMVRQARGPPAGWSGEHVLPGLVQVTRFLHCDGRAGHDVVDADTALAVPGMVAPLA